MPGTLFLIDGHYQIYRSFFGMPTLTNSGGRPVHVAYAISDLLLRLRRDLKAERWAIALDSPGPTFRHREYPEYKANREEMPRELREQLPWVEEILEGFRIPVLRADGYEADDIIATLCGWAEEHGLDVRILSKDKDLEQLLTDRVKLVDEKSGRLYGPRELLEKKGITPEQVVAYQSLTGDSSDNIPGVPGIGPKTAAKILRSIADLDRLLEDPAPEGVPPRALERIRENRGSMQLSRRLAELARDVPLPAEESGYRVLSPDEERLRPLFRSLGLQRFLKMLDSEAEGGRGDPPAPVGGGAAEAPSAAEPAAEGAARYLLVEDLACLDGVLEECRRAGRFAFDTETTGLDPIVDRAVGFSLAARAGEAWYVPLESPSGRPPMAREEVLRRLRPLLEDRGVGKIGQNIKYDALVMQGDGITLRGIVFDPMIAAYLINPLRGSYKLDELVGERLGHTMIPIHEIIGPRGEERSMAQIEPQEICEYAAEDADYTLRLAEELEPEIGELGLKRVYEQLELPLIEVLVAMELEGITLDLGRLEEQEEAISRSLEEQEAEIHRLAGEAFNVKSPKQLQEVLFQRLGLPALRKIKTGYSTSAGVLEELASLHPEQPLPERILEYRSLSKLLNTYIQALPGLVKEKTGRLHTDFRQTVAATGRLSSMRPNLQNIPVKTELGRLIRRAFVPNHEDHVFLSADYSQIELRLLAHLSGDERLTAALCAGGDIHSTVAASIHGKPIEEVTREERAAAKAVDFGIIYGMGPFGLARDLKIPIAEARGFIEAFFSGFPGVRSFIEKIKEEAREQGEVRTLFGRRRPLPEIRSRLPRERSQAERFAVNTVVQGSAADIIKKAMIDIHRSLEESGSPSSMLLQIHDELLFEVPRSHLDRESRRIRRGMEEVLTLDVPLEVTISSGEDWYAASK